MTAPYYQDDAVTIYHGDALELMHVGHLADVTITDPPYGETSLDWDRWPTGWLEALASSTPLWSPLWCFGSMRMFIDRGAEFPPWKLAQDIVHGEDFTYPIEHVVTWEKHNGSSFHADRFKRVHEYIVQWYRGPWSGIERHPVTTNDATARQVRRKDRPPHTGDIGASSYTSVDGGPKLARSVLYVRSEHGTAIHPTQKPLGILAPLIDYSTTRGQTVFDPFAGSGSTLIATREAGRKAIGIEAREDYCEAIVTRLNQQTLGSLA